MKKSILLCIIPLLLIFNCKKQNSSQTETNVAIKESKKKTQFPTEKEIIKELEFLWVKELDKKEKCIVHLLTRNSHGLKPLSEKWFNYFDSIKYMTTFNFDKNVTQIKPSKDKNLIALCHAENISMKTAKNLASFQGSLVFLPRLENLDVKTAQALSPFGDGYSNTQLILGLTSIDEKTAEIFAEFNMEKLILNELKNISDEALGFLSLFPGESITLGLENISPKGMEYLSQREGTVIFSKLKNLNATTSKILWESQANYLSLPRWNGKLENFIGFEKFNGRTLVLGQENINVPIAAKIVQYGGRELVLDNLIKIDKESIFKLSSFDGRSLSIKGLSKIDAEIYPLICKHKRMQFWRANCKKNY